MTACLMRPIVLAHPGGEPLATTLAVRLGADPAPVTMHVFPDGESCPRVQADVGGRAVVLVASLDRPDSKLASLYLLAMALREQKARRVILVAPYLPYMRQDRPFRPGEGTSARHFAALLSSCIDGLVTVDPHLHRVHQLDEIYSVPSRAVASAPAIAGWIGAHIANPVLIGPDEESAQWVEQVASRVDAPWTVLRKIRHGDHDVEVSLPDANRLRGRTPVLVDDILSTARTMMAAVHRVRELDLDKPVCIGVHAIFAGSAWAELQAAGAAQIVTCNTIVHRSNAIDIAPLLAEAVAGLAAGTTP